MDVPASSLMASRRSSQRPPHARVGATQICGRPAPRQLRTADKTKHPGMHITDTIDYAIILFGEMYAVMDDGETLMRAGDVLVQRGTNHAWSNRSGQVCRVAFILI